MTSPAKSTENLAVFAAGVGRISGCFSNPCCCEERHQCLGMTTTLPSERHNIIWMLDHRWQAAALLASTATSSRWCSWLACLRVTTPDTLAGLLWHAAGLLAWRGCCCHLRPPATWLDRPECVSGVRVSGCWMTAAVRTNQQHHRDRWHSLVIQHRMAGTTRCLRIWRPMLPVSQSGLQFKLFFISTNFSKQTIILPPVATGGIWWHAPSDPQSGLWIGEVVLTSACMPLASWCSQQPTTSSDRETNCPCVARHRRKRHPAGTVAALRLSQKLFEKSCQNGTRAA